MSLPSKSSVQTSNLVSFSRNKFPLFVGWRKHDQSIIFNNGVPDERGRGWKKIEKLEAGGVYKAPKSRSSGYSASRLRESSICL